MALLDSVVNVIVSPFTIIWEWLLLNVITPVLLIVVLVLFFVGQFYLIKAYIAVIKFVVLRILQFYNFVINSSKLKSAIAKVDEALEKIN